MISAHAHDTSCLGSEGVRFSHGNINGYTSHQSLNGLKVTRLLSVWDEAHGDSLMHVSAAGLMKKKKWHHMQPVCRIDVSN